MDQPGEQSSTQPSEPLVIQVLRNLEAQRLRMAAITQNWEGHNDTAENLLVEETEIRVES